MIKIPFFRTAFNYDTNEASDASSLRCEDPSLAQQHMLEETDINTIVKRFGLTGTLPEGVRLPSYGDFDGVSDFHSAVNAIALASESFDSLPADLRYRFHNDPGSFVAFCSDPANQSELVSLGLADSPPVVVSEPGAPIVDNPI